MNQSFRTLTLPARSWLRRHRHGRSDGLSPADRSESSWAVVFLLPAAARGKVGGFRSALFIFFLARILISFEFSGLRVHCKHIFRIFSRPCVPLQCQEFVARVLFVWSQAPNEVVEL